MLADVIQAAFDADKAFAAAVVAAGFKSRWDRGVNAHPAVAPARDAKHAADRALHLAFVASRKG